MTKDGTSDVSDILWLQIKKRMVSACPRGFLQSMLQKQQFIFTMYVKIKIFLKKIMEDFKKAHMLNRKIYSWEQK